MTRALLPPVWRTLPRRALAAAAAVGLLLAGIPRLQSGPPDPRVGLYALRAAALVLALGLAFLLDDPARHITSTVPARRPVRVALRVALVAPWAALTWTTALLLVPEESRPPAGALTLEAAATAVVALAAATLSIRHTRTSEPGAAISTWLLVTGVTAALLLPHDWTLFVTPGDPRWQPTHDHWALLLTVAAIVGARACAEPVRAGLRLRPFRTAPSRGAL
ncbi:ABC transporter [Streptomyces sp. NPDC060205]|uniref:ABC transporter n=1 Tax=Streptomyces sp. NPDC060205 TaxID=3347072 RepID=UPI003658FA69